MTFSKRRARDFPLASALSGIALSAAAGAGGCSGDFSASSCEETLTCARPGTTGDDPDGATLAEKPGRGGTASGGNANSGAGAGMPPGPGGSSASAGSTGDGSGGGHRDPDASIASDDPGGGSDGGTDGSAKDDGDADGGIDAPFVQPDGCPFGFADCNDSDSDGCETHIVGDASNCGACSNQCDLTNVNAPACVDGACTPVCEAGFSDCNGSAPGTSGDGCEVSLLDDVQHCGACDNACDGANVLDNRCVSGLCRPVCEMGFTDCELAPAGAPGNGCEANLDMDPNHCGLCGNVCNTDQVADNVCADGLCTPLCESGYSDCVVAAAGDPGDGCETNTNADVTNCGACGVSCSSANVSTNLCVAGTCAPACKSGFDDCSPAAPGTAGDGCEVDLSLPTSCGTCDRDCLGGTCEAFACGPVLLASGLEAIGKRGYATIEVVQGYIYFGSLEGNDTPPSYIYRRSTGTNETAWTEIVEAEPWATAATDTHLVYSFYDLHVLDLPNGPASTIAGSAIQSEAMVTDGSLVFHTGYDSTYGLHVVGITGTPGPTRLVDLPTTDTQLELAGGRVWIANNGGLASIPKTGGPLEWVAGVAAVAVVADATHVYFGDDGTLGRIPLAGGPPESVNTWATGPAVVMDDYGDSIIVLTETRLHRVPKDGSAAVTLAEGFTNGVDLVVVDGVAYYRSQLFDGELYKIVL